MDQLALDLLDDEEIAAAAQEHKNEADTDADEADKPAKRKHSRKPLPEHPVNHLAGYTCTVHADGYAGFNGLFGQDKANEQACMVHVRRKFTVSVAYAQARPSPKRPSSGSASFMRWRSKPRANYPKKGSTYGSRKPNPSLMIWRSGCRPNYQTFGQNQTGKGDPLHPETVAKSARLS